MDALREENKKLTEELSRMKEENTKDSDSRKKEDAEHAKQLQNLQTMLDRSAKSEATSQQEICRYRDTIHHLTKKYEELEAYHVGLERELSDTKVCAWSELLCHIF